MNIRKIKLNKYSILLFFVMIFAALLRMKYFGIHRFHVDEALYSSWAIRMFERFDFLLNGAAGVDKPPLLMLLQSISFFIFGLSENSARYPNFLASLVSIYIIYRIGSYYFNKTTGVLSAVIMSCSTMHLAYSNTAFTDMLMLTMGLAGIAFITIQKYKWAGVFTLLAFATKQFGLLFLPLAFCLVGLEIYKEETFDLFKHNKMKEFFKAFGISLGILLFITAFSNPSVGFLLYLHASHAEVITLAGKLMMWWNEYLKLFPALSIAYFSALTVGGIFIYSIFKIMMFVRDKAITSRIIPDFLFSGFIICYFLLLAMAGVFGFTRYALLWVPFVVLLMSFVIERFVFYPVRKIKTGKAKEITTVIVLSVLIGSSIWMTYSNLEQAKLNYGAFYSSNDGIEQVTDYLRKLPESPKVLLMKGAGWGYNFYANGIKFKKKMDIKSIEDVKEAMETFDNANIYLSLQNAEDIGAFYNEAVKQFELEKLVSTDKAGGKPGFVLYRILKNN